MADREKFKMQLPFNTALRLHTLIVTTNSTLEGVRFANISKASAKSCDFSYCDKNFFIVCMYDNFTVAKLSFMDYDVFYGSSIYDKTTEFNYTLFISSMAL